MRLSELQNKDVVDVLTGERIGNIIDIEISKEDGIVKKIILYEKKGLFSTLKNNGEIKVDFTDIKKIGQDVILVNKN